MTEGDRRRRFPGGRRPSGAPARSVAHARFLALDREKALREWHRYEGTAQRELFRVLRERFLRRHAGGGGWVLDAGSGPGRFTPVLGGNAARRVALDLSRAMLAVGRELGDRLTVHGVPRPERVRGDARRPPFRSGSFASVALVGNALGFEASEGTRLLNAVEDLIAPGGTLVLEIAPGPGERSRYLARLPPGAVRRLVAAPLAAVLPRLDREGFAPEPVRHQPAAFRRWTAGELGARWRPPTWLLREVMAVAPALGPDRARLDAVARDPASWTRLVELEEAIGGRSARWSGAAAVLLAVARAPSVANDFERGQRSLRA